MSATDTSDFSVHETSHNGLDVTVVFLDLLREQASTVRSHGFEISFDPETRDLMIRSAKLGFSFAINSATLILSTKLTGPSESEVAGDPGSGQMCAE